MKQKRKTLKPSSVKIGKPPTALEYTGDRTDEQVTMTRIDYSASHFSSQELDLRAPIEPVAPGAQRWLNIEGLRDTELIRRIGELYQIHPLVLEDVLHVDQRPKLDDYETYLFLVAHMIKANPAEETLSKEQVSFVLGRNWLITFQDGEAGDCFDKARNHLSQPQTRLRAQHPDFLLHALLDAMVDQYYVVIEQFGEWIENLEDKVVESPDPRHVKRIYHFKRELMLLRRSVWPLREAVGLLAKNESELLDPKTIVYLRDLYDHTIQCMETIETYRDVVASLLDIYLSSQSNRMNEIMKVLTMIATLFIPLTFIVGVYGMNFDFMPELHSKWGYPSVWAVMLLIAGCMLIYFRKKKWL